jgi:HD-GYP domain-containing protein (c-di-GMP phosphodiesterase class II)
MALYTPVQTNFQPMQEIRTGAYGYQEPETEGHTRRVADLTVHLAREMDVPGDELIDIHRGALLHDIGMTNVPDHIVHKPELLTDAEWKIICLHPVYARQLLKKVSRHSPGIIDIPYCHHEKWDGSGYPRGLKDESIPFTARLFTIADVWDSLTSDRPYRPAWTWIEAMEYIDEQSGKHFDPDVTRVFLKGRANIEL